MARAKNGAGKWRRAAAAHRCKTESSVPVAGGAGINVLTQRIVARQIGVHRLQTARAKGRANVIDPHPACIGRCIEHIGAEIG